MAYGAAAGTNYDGLSIASLPPGIYKGYELKEVKAERTTKADGTQGTQIITFLFDGPNGPHQHTEYEVNDNDVAKKASKEANLFKRVAHIMTKYVSRTVVDAASFATFGELSTWVVTTLAPVTKGIKVDIKVMGNVYNGEAKSNFPGYPPFIARPDQPEYKPLFFSDRENAENNKYANHMNNATPDQEQSTATSTGASGATVDTDF